VFGYGCNLGPNQTARHASNIATAPALRRINAPHINVDKLEGGPWWTSSTSMSASRCRGTGAAARTAIADGTHVKLRENNLIGSRHIRYGGYGGIAYHHIADTYITLFPASFPAVYGRPFISQPLPFEMAL
jgi:TnpA family transposase